MSSGAQHERLAVKCAHDDRDSARNGDLKKIKTTKDNPSISLKPQKSTQPNRDKQLSGNFLPSKSSSTPKKLPELAAATPVTNGTSGKPIVVNQAGKVRISPFKNNGKSSASRGYGGEKSANGSLITSAAINGGLDKAHRLFFPVATPSLATLTPMLAFPSHTNSQRKPQTTAEVNRELVNQLNAILSTNPASSRTDKLLISKADTPIKPQTVEVEKSSSSKKPKVSARSSPLPPLRNPGDNAKKSSKPKTVPIAPQGSRPTHSQVHLLPTQFVGGTPTFFLQHPVIQQQLLSSSALSSSVIPIPSAVVFPNGLLTTPQQRVISPVSRNLVNIAPKPPSGSPTPPVKKHKSSEKLSPAKNASLPSKTHPILPPVPPKPTVPANPVSINEDLDQLLSCVQSKISQDFGRTVSVTSPNLFSPVSPAAAEKSFSSPNPKVLISRLRRFRKRIKRIDIAVEEDVQTLTGNLSRFSISEKPVVLHVPLESTPVMPTSFTDSSRVLPFKKRHYKSVPSPKTKESCESSGKSSAIQSAKEKPVTLPNGPSSRSEYTHGKNKDPCHGVGSSVETAGKPPPIKISLKINRDSAGNPIVSSPPRSTLSPSSSHNSSSLVTTKVSKKRKLDHSADASPPKRRSSTPKIIVPENCGPFDLQDNICSAARLKKPIPDTELHICECKPVPAGTKGVVGCGFECQTRMVFFECDPQHCPCGDACSNQVIQRHQWVKDLEVFDTKLKGKGVRCKNRITKGTLICEYVGEVISIDKFRNRMSKQYKNFPHHYCLNIDANTVIDAYQKGNIGRFINHSCEPNSHVEKWHVNGQPRMAIFASKDILPGEEITYDYNFDCYDNQQKCSCDAKTCRMLIGSKSQKLNAVLSAKRAKNSQPQSAFINGQVTSGMDLSTVSPLTIDYSRPDVFSFMFSAAPPGSKPVTIPPNFAPGEHKLNRRKKVFLVRNLRVFSRRRTDIAKKRSKPVSLFPPVALPGLTVEAIAELKIRKPPAEVAAPAVTSANKFPVAFFKPTHWEPDVRKYTVEYHEEVIRCICNVYSEEGRMIMCDKCNAWQHCECIGVISHKDSYLCERCLPRLVPTEIHQNLPAVSNPDNLDCFVTLNVPNCQNFQARVGDCVYLTEKRLPPQPGNLFDPLALDILRIDKMFVEPDGTKKAYGYHLLRPHETTHEASRSFHENELLMSPIVEAVNLEAVLGRCCVMDPLTYVKGKPREFPLQHCFICEFKVNKKANKFDRVTAKEKIFINQENYYFETYPEKLQLKRTYRPHGVPVLKKKLKADAGKKATDQPKAIIHYVKEKCQRIQKVTQKLQSRNIDKFAM